MIKLSDYVSNFLLKAGVKDIFLLSGGGIMHLLDSVTKNKDINLYFNLNEQASGICAESYAQFTGRLGVCMVTTGPGATNAITGCAGAWTDSTPTLFISGQCKVEQMGQLKGLRFYGAQEIAIVPMVTPITKYAVTILKKEEIRYHLEKAIYLANNDRKGPVWIDIPLDIQGSMIDEESLIPFTPPEHSIDKNNLIYEKLEELMELLNNSKRPAFLIGHGVVSSKSEHLIKRICKSASIPVLSTWRAKGVFSDCDELFMGMPGAPGTRYSNYVLQNSDLLIIVGTRLNPVITAFDEKNFGRNAKKIYVEIEEKEIEKLDIDFDIIFNMDAGVFLSKLQENIENIIQIDRSMWLNYCANVKKRYSLENEIQPTECQGVDGYKLAFSISRNSNEYDVFVGSSSGRTCGISHLALNIKDGQKFVTSMGLGSMGWCVPSAIACSVASGKRRTIVIEGDGSLQHNLQELQLIKTYQLPVKLFIYNNNGYASIFSMQKNNFCERLSGCNQESRLELPNIQKIAELYDIKYIKINTNEEIEDAVKLVLMNNDAVICEVMGSIEFDEIPKSLTIAKDDGTFISSKLENLYPFLSKEETAENMPNWSKE